MTEIVDVRENSSWYQGNYFNKRLREGVLEETGRHARSRWLDWLNARYARYDRVPIYNPTHKSKIAKQSAS